MRKYDSYKDSGIEWIGEIPEHWTIATIGRLTNLGRGRVISAIEIAENEGEFPVYSSQTENNGIMGCLNSFDFEGEYVTWTTDGANAGTVFYREGKFNCTNVCGTIQPKNWEQIELKFLPYYLNLGTKFSVRLDINPKLMNNMMAKIPLVIPPKTEQTAIAAYLDRKTAEIDELIADKKRLLELYEEEKTAIINQAVTKGINADAPMKDSGIEWLGEIPEHWEVKRIRHVAQIFGRIGYRGYKTTDLVQKGEGAITISPSNMKGYYMDFSDCSYLSWEKYEESPEIMIFNGDILFVKTGSTYGKSSLVENLPEKATINPQIIVLKEIQCNNKLLWYNIKSEYTQFQVEGTVVGGTIPTISQAKINNYEFVITPDEKEQQAIVDFIDKECTLIDSKKAKTEKLIELLTEYRTALISEVVTGKIKVTD